MSEAEDQLEFDDDESGDSRPELPPADFDFLIYSLRLQAELNIGLLPFGEKRAPDFELGRHNIDLLAMLQEKMREYIANGAQLGWLIDPTSRRVYIYRAPAEIECLDNPATVSGEPILAGFVLALAEIWQTDF